MNAAEKVCCLIAVLASLATNTCPGAACPVITNQPTDVAMYQCQTATFSVGATGMTVLRFQWYANGAPISGATKPTLYVSSGTGSEFFVVVSNTCGAVTSAVAHLYTYGDVVPPTLHTIEAAADLRHIFLTFYPCPLLGEFAEEDSNYAISGGIIISNATFFNQTNVALTTSLMEPSSRHELTIGFMRDVEGNDTTDFPPFPFWTPPRRLSFTRTHDVLHLTWPTGAVLQQSLTVTSAWLDVSNELNSAAISNGPTRFFRVRFP